MEITRSAPCTHGRFEGGDVTFGIYLSPDSDCDDDELNEAISVWAAGGDVEINIRFSLTECVEELIDFHRTWQNKEVVTMQEENRPMIDALKAEIASISGKLASIRFEP